MPQVMPTYHSRYQEILYLPTERELCDPTLICLAIICVPRNLMLKPATNNFSAKDVMPMQF